MDAFGAADERIIGGRRSRVVLIARRWYQVIDNASHCAGDGGKKARLTRESAKETVKTIRAGKAGRFKAYLW